MAKLKITIIVLALLFGCGCRSSLHVECNPDGSVKSYDIVGAGADVKLDPTVCSKPSQLAH